MPKWHRMPDGDHTPVDDYVEALREIKRITRNEKGLALQSPLPSSSLFPPNEDRIAALEARLAGAKITIDNRERQIDNLKRKLTEQTVKAVSAPIREVLTALREHCSALQAACAKETNPTKRRELNLQAEAVGQMTAKIRLILQETQAAAREGLTDDLEKS